MSRTSSLSEWSEEDDLNVEDDNEEQEDTEEFSENEDADELDCSVEIEGDESGELSLFYSVRFLVMILFSRMLLFVFVYSLLLFSLCQEGFESTNIRANLS